MKERALSEVIGFLMIVALLTILFSMYLLYVVPIQGRDAEISHMKYITQEFIGLKADIDGLIINNKVNLPIARSFELGTLSSVGSGSLSILPLSSFIEATGLLMVNEQNDFLAVTVNGSMVKIDKASRNPTIIEINCSSFDLCPEVPKNYTVGDRFYNITTKARYSLEPNNGNLSLPHVYLNVTNLSSNINSSVVFYYNISSYDLILETRENSTTDPKPLISEKTLIENLSFGRYYAYNLLDDNALIPNNSTDYSMIEDQISTEYFINNTTTKIGMFPPRIGSFQYESSNRYWVNQNLLFEMGGLFLNQPADGGSSVMLIPSIALTPVKDIDTDDWVLKVSINNIRITDTEDISGSVSAQIFSKVDHINHNLLNGSEKFSNYGSSPSEPATFWKLKEGTSTNARAVWLQFIPDDPRVTNSTYWDPTGTISASDHERMKKTTELWKRGFDQIKTITNKTISDDPDKGEFSGWIYNFRIEDSTGSTNPPYSANMVIGATASTLRSSCPPITDSTKAAVCQEAVQKYLGNATGREFILDYAESEVSLVMQSGAL